nr:MAG TPA: hypothetical protein [Crassvirales sp.]
MVIFFLLFLYSFMHFNFNICSTFRCCQINYSFSI